MQLVARRTVLAAGLGGAAALALDVALAPTIAYPGAQARIGAPAPAFTLADSNGKTVSLADFKGKTVVLEWTNHDCPYVRKHYGGNNMQTLQKKWTAQGVVWLTLISSAPGTRGLRLGRRRPTSSPPSAARRRATCCSIPRATSAAPTARRRPRTCTSSRATARSSTWAASTTSRPTRLDDLKTAKNFVDAALSEMAQGKPVSVTTSRPYGCSIKYSS